MKKVRQTSRSVGKTSRMKNPNHFGWGDVFTLLMIGVGSMVIYFEWKYLFGEDGLRTFLLIASGTLAYFSLISIFLSIFSVFRFYDYSDEVDIHEILKGTSRTDERRAQREEEEMERFIQDVSLKSDTVRYCDKHFVTKMRWKKPLIRRTEARRILDRLISEHRLEKI